MANFWPGTTLLGEPPKPGTVQQQMSRTLTIRSLRKSAVTPAEALVVPMLRYRNPAAAVEWLHSAFGLNCHFSADQGGTIVRAQFRLGTALVFLGPERMDDKYGAGRALTLAGTNQCVHIATNRDVDAHCAQACRAGAEILTWPRDTPYGSREYTCRDPEGHVWSIGSFRGEP